MTLKIEFEDAVWQKIVDMLSTQPYREVGPIIAAMAQQFAAQQEKTNGTMESNSEALHSRGAIRTINGVGTSGD